MTCTRCSGSGFLNIHQIPDNVLNKFDEEGDCEIILKWMKENQDSDVQVCDCCGDGYGWYREPGCHFKGEEYEGVYDYNGGLPECY